jgi:4-amino-4-deoxy-L-arabinose transferase-like glycosyltransferase
LAATTDRKRTLSDPDLREVAPFEWRPVLSICAAVVILLMAVSSRYGWHRDELYFRVAGEHLAWGYVDQPPFTPLVARIAEVVARNNLAVLRLLPALTTAVTVALGGLLAREFGGHRRAQIAGAAAVAAGGFVLGVGHLLSTAVFDLTAWMALLWLTARLLRTGDGRWWIGFGTVAGFSMLNKNLLVLLCAALVCGLLIERRWDLLTSRWLFVGAAIALAIAAPNLVWESRHGWPQFEMARVLSKRLGGENRAMLLPLQLVLVGPALIFLLWRGARWLAREPSAHRFRALLWAWPAALIAAFATGGRPYYIAPLSIAVMLAGVVATEQRVGIRRLAWFIVANALISLPIALPVLPVSAGTANLNEAVAETVGWPELTRQVAQVVSALPTRERDSVVILTASYGEAGAIDRFGPALGLPRPFSPHNSYADFGQPTDDRATVVAVRYAVGDLARYFDRCRKVATVDNRHGVKNEAQGKPILVCHGLRGDWTDVWKRMRFLS